MSPGKYQNAVQQVSNPLEVNVKDEVVKFFSTNGWLPSVSTNWPWLKVDDLDEEL